jgi:DNA-binding CsgD family transcriptional regulator
MRGEFYAVKALTLAVLGESNESGVWLEKARELTACVEARAYAACAASILMLRSGASSAKAVSIMSEAKQIGVWDAFISAMRAWPPLLAALIDAGPVDNGVIAALRRAHDFDLSKQVGLDIGRRPRGLAGVGGLSPREKEVLDLVGQGFSNHDIARALFIAESTVKVHVRHILKKTGARSRTEAATTRES